MRITGIDLHHIKIPFAAPYKLSKKYGTLTDAHAVIVKIHTDDGVTGVGEADPLNPFTEETPGTVMAVMRDAIAPLILGMDPTRINMVEGFLDQAVLGHPTARGAVNMALFDILGKVRNAPIYDLLGGMAQFRLPIMGAIGSGTPDEDADAIEKWVERGCDTVMIKMGVLPIRDEIRRLEAAQDRFGEKVRFIVDANQGWDAPQALAFMDGVRGFPPYLMEQPVDRVDLHGLARIRGRAVCPVSADESLVGLDDAARLIEHRAVDAFSLKVSKNGGLSATLKIAHAAQAFGLRCLMNSMLEFGVTQAASLQLGCTLTNLLDCGHAYMSVLRMGDDITDFGDFIDGATVRVPAGPGLGVQLDEDKLNHYTVASLRLPNGKERNAP
jgi:muconate cycloisomerase